VYAAFSIFVGSWYPAGYPTLAEWYAWMIGITVISVISGILIYAISQQRGGAGWRSNCSEMALIVGEGEMSSANNAASDRL
jgi:hypothetical protein